MWEHAVKGQPQHRAHNTQQKQHEQKQYPPQLSNNKSEVHEKVEYFLTVLYLKTGPCWLLWNPTGGLSDQQRLSREKKGT